jgi:hypothetical protein
MSLNAQHLAIALSCLVLTSQPTELRAQQSPAPAQAAQPSDAERKAQIFNSDCWRRAMFERDEWLRTQTIFPPAEVARIKADFQARLDAMSPVELEMVLADLQLKFQMLNTPEARDVRAWFGNYLSILSAQRREEMLKQIPDLAKINSQQLQQTLTRIAQQRNSRQQQQAQTRQLRAGASNPWNQPRPAPRPAASNSAYHSPFRPPSFERPFENVRSGSGSMTVGPDGQIWRTFGM